MDHEMDETGVLSMQEVDIATRECEKLLFLFHISFPLSWL
jgi:hypothetical protein